MAQNPETIITKRISRSLQDLGAHVIKLSDQFTRGVPDMVVVTDRVVLIEYKVDRLKRDPSHRTYRGLGLSGAQDHHIRQFARRCPGSACVVTDSPPGDKLRLWLPTNATSEGPGFEDYVCIAKGERVYEWLMDRPRT